MWACGSKILIDSSALVMWQGPLGRLAAVRELARALGLDGRQLRRGREAVDHVPHLGGDVAPGGDALVHERGEHARGAARRAPGQPVERRDRDADEDALEHRLVVGGVVEVLGRVRAERGGDQARVVRADGVVDDAERARRRSAGAAARAAARGARRRRRSGTARPARPPPGPPARRAAACARRRRSSRRARRRRRSGSSGARPTLRPAIGKRMRTAAGSADGLATASRSQASASGSTRSSSRAPERSLM